MRNPGSLHRVAAVALLFIFAMVSVGATTYYLRSDGNDANTGTANTSTGAWKTLTHALLSVGPNDVLMVDGSGSPYNEGPSQLNV